MPPEVADHVAAVALFGKPSTGFLQRIDNTAPPINIGHLYADKTVDMCVPEDPICSADGSDNAAHGSYGDNGMTNQAADFAARQIASTAESASASR
jgi:cutinase